MSWGELAMASSAASPGQARGLGEWGGSTSAAEFREALTLRVTELLLPLAAV